MEKLIYLLGDTPPGSIPFARSDLRDAVFGVWPALERVGVRRADLTVADLEEGDVGAVPQFNPHGLMDAKVSFWLDSLDQRDECESLLKPLARHLAGFVVTESVPLARSGFSPSPGRRNPGVVLVTALKRRSGLDSETFYARWHGSHTPLSLEVHPLLHYVRNTVARSLTPHGAGIEGIVDESVESVAVLADPVAFYRSEEDRARVVRDLLSFTELETLTVSLMSEYTLSL